MRLEQSRPSLVRVRPDSVISRSSAQAESVAPRSANVLRQHLRPQNVATSLHAVLPFEGVVGGATPTPLAFSTQAPSDSEAGPLQTSYYRSIEGESGTVKLLARRWRRSLLQGWHAAEHSHWPGHDPRRMRIKLERRFVERLSNLPESGMGYQRVDIRLSDGRELKDVVVFNAEEADVPDEFAQAKITDVRPSRCLISRRKQPWEPEPTNSPRPGHTHRSVYVLGCWLGARPTNLITREWHRRVDRRVGLSQNHRLRNASTSRLALKNRRQTRWPSRQVSGTAGECR